MLFTEKLDILMKKNGLTRGSLADKTDIPYNTIVGFYTRGYKNMKLSNLKKIAEFFEVPIDILVDDETDLEKYFSGKEKDNAPAGYASLSPKGKGIVNSLIDGLLDMEASGIERQPAKKIYIKEYLTPAAAGYASPAEGEDYTLIEKDDAVPAAADFAVKIDGDSMEPVIKDGSRVYVSRTNELSDGDVGIFFVDGDMKCKQYCEDSFGNIYLFSVNRDRKDADVFISASSGITVFCFGKVLLGGRIPLPKI